MTTKYAPKQTSTHGYTVQINNMEIHYEEYGTGKPLVLFLFLIPPFHSPQPPCGSLLGQTAGNNQRKYNAPLWAPATNQQLFYNPINKHHNAKIPARKWERHWHAKKIDNCAICNLPDRIILDFIIEARFPIHLYGKKKRKLNSV